LCFPYDAIAQVEEKALISSGLEAEQKRILDFAVAAMEHHRQQTEGSTHCELLGARAHDQNDSGDVDGVEIILHLCNTPCHSTDLLFVVLAVGGHSQELVGNGSTQQAQMLQVELKLDHLLRLVQFVIACTGRL